MPVAAAAVAVAPGGVARVGVGASARRPTMALLVDARRVQKKKGGWGWGWDLRRVGVDPVHSYLRRGRRRDTDCDGKRQHGRMSERAREAIRTVLPVTDRPRALVREEAPWHGHGWAVARQRWTARGYWVVAHTGAGRGWSSGTRIEVLCRDSRLRSGQYPAPADECFRAPAPCTTAQLQPRRRYCQQKACRKGS